MRLAIRLRMVKKVRAGLKYKFTKKKLPENQEAFFDLQ